MIITVIYSGRDGNQKLYLSSTLSSILTSSSETSKETLLEADESRLSK